MLTFNRVRLKALGAASRVMASAPSEWKFEKIELPPIPWPEVDLSRWPTQRPKFLRLWILLVVFMLSVLYYGASAQEPILVPEETFRPRTAPYYNSTAHPRHIPPKIWQVYLDFAPYLMNQYMDHIHSWIAHSPSYDYTILDKGGALGVMSSLTADPAHARILPLYYAMSRRVMRADFLRYLLLAVEGGVYSDMDTHLVRRIDDWIPEPFRAATRMIVGLEADQSPPVRGTTYEVQFCQWTLAAAPGHPAMWAMVDHILEEVQNRPYQVPALNVEYSDDEVLNITGPAAWTPVVFDFLSRAVGEPVTWHNLTGMTSPRLFGDILVMPINAFTSGVPHSGSVSNSPDALVKHAFGGSWRNGVSR